VDCSICGAEIKTGAMEKIHGTYLRKKGKLYPICGNCQKMGEDKALKELK